MSELKSKQEELLKLEDRLLKHRQFCEMWNQKWMPTKITLERLKRSPDGSLGHAYLKYLERFNLSVEFAPEAKINRPIHYVSHRMQHAHDIWHTVLDYDCEIGEMELQGFSLGQLESPLAVLLITAGFINVLTKNPQNSAEVFERTARAYFRGKNARFLLDYPLEDMLDHPLDQLRERLSV